MLTLVKLFSKRNTMVAMRLSSYIVTDGIKYSELFEMCITTTTTPSLIAVWASPVGLKAENVHKLQLTRILSRVQMLFEVLVLFLTILNIFDRPRIANVRIATALHRDGITFFVV